MDYQFEREWKETQDWITRQMGQKLDYAGILFNIGLQELNKDFGTYKKDQKLEIIHIGMCSLLVKEGYYTFVGRDEEGWPHFERVESLPPLQADEQELLLKRCIIQYFKEFIR